MSGAVDKKEILNIEGLDADRKNVIETLKAIAATAVELSKTLGDTKGLKDLTGALKALNQVQAEFTKFQRQSVDMAVKAERIKQQEAKTALENVKIQEQEEKVRTQTNKTKLEESKININNAKAEKIINTEKKESVKLTNEQRLAIQLANKEEKLRITIANSEEGSYDRLNAQYQLNIISLNKMSEATRNNSTAAKTLEKDNAMIVSKLNQLDAQSGKTKRSFNGLQWQVTQLARELPSLAYGANVFFGAIGNNLPMLIDEIKALSAANKLAAAECRATIPVWKQVAGSIINWQTAVIIAITALTLYGRELSAWTKELFKGRDAVNSLSDAMKVQNKTAQDLGVEMAKEKTAMKLNFLVANDITRSYGERLGAANKLISKYPEILGSYTAEQLLTSKLSDTYDQLTKAIEKSFEARFAEEKILENYREMAKQQKIIDDGGTMWGKFSRLTVKYTKDLDVAKNKITQIKEENRKLFEQFNVQEDDKFGIIAASKEFEIYSKLQSKETKKVFAERSSFVSNDAQTYKQWLINQLVVYKDNVDAKIALEQELSTFLEKDKKGNKFTELEKLQDQHKKELEETAEYQQELLSNTELSEEQILQAKVDNAKELIRIRIEQIAEEKKLANPEQKSALDVELAKQEKLLAKTTANFIIAEQKRLSTELIEEEKRLAKERLEIRRKLTDDTISEASAEADKQILNLQEVAINEIVAAKGNKEKVSEIQHELTMNIIAEKVAEQDAILQTAGLEPQAYEQANQRKRQILIQGKEEEIAWADRTEEEKKSLTRETMQATNALLQTGLSFAQNIYSAQAERAQQTYDSEMEAAGDSLEAQIKAKRKFEAEDKKIKQKQAITSKLQAVLDASLALALAIATTWKNPLLATLNISAATLGLGMALATPIPQYAKGTKNSEDTFIAGEKKSEIIVTPEGDLMVTPNQATLYSDPKLKGSTVIPNPEVSNFLANLAMNNTRDIIDMSQTNKHLSNMEKSLKKKDTAPYINAKGKLVEKKGSITYIHS